MFYMIFIGNYFQTIPFTAKNLLSVHRVYGFYCCRRRFHVRNVIVDEWVDGWMDDTRLNPLSRGGFGDVAVMRLDMNGGEALVD